ncbi:MAG: hypothetical protein AAFU73_16955 [Planctomycetota bacterium]
MSETPDPPTEGPSRGVAPSSTTNDNAPTRVVREVRRAAACALAGVAYFALVFAHLVASGFDHGSDVPEWLVRTPVVCGAAAAIFLVRAWAARRSGRLGASGLALAALALGYAAFAAVGWTQGWF